MPNEDILLRVRVDSTQAIGEINRLLNAVGRAERQSRTRQNRSIDSLRTELAGASVTANQDLRLAENRALRPNILAARERVKSLAKEINDIERLVAQIGARGKVRAGAAQGLAPSGGDLNAFLRAAQRIASIGQLPGALGLPAGANGTAALRAILAPIVASAGRGTLQQDLLRQRDALQRRLSIQQANPRTPFGQTRTIEDLIDVNRQIQTLSRILPSLRFAGAASQIAQLTTQLKNASIAAQKFSATFSPPVQKLKQQLVTLQQREQERTIAGQIPSRGNISAQILNLQRQQALGVRGLTGEMKRLTDIQKQYALQWDTATKTFTHHALRIAEGLILYNAFTRSIEGIAAGFRLIAEIDRDTARLGQVLSGLTSSQAQGFLSDLGDVAVSTATDFRELLAVTDLVAGAFRSIAASEGLPTDAASILPQVSGFQEIIGQFTNVIGPGNNPEAVAQQLTALFRITNEGLADIPELAEMEPLERFRRFMDTVVTIGHRSAFEIENISAGLVEVGLNANLAGADLRFVTGLLDQLIFRTGQGGAEIGTLLRTSFAKLSDPDVLKGFEDIVGGAVQVRDSVGQLRDADDILIQLFQAVQTGALTSEQSRQALQELIPPINPGAVGLNNQLIASIGGALQEMTRDANEGTGALDEMSIIIANTLPGRFQSFASRLQVTMLGLQEDIEDITIGFLRFGNSVLDILDSLGPEFVSTTARMLAFTGGGLVLLALLEKFGLAFLGIKGGLAGIAVALNATAIGARLLTAQTVLANSALLTTAGAASAAAGGMGLLSARLTLTSLGMRAVAVGAGVARVAIGALMALAARVLPLLAAFIAFDQIMNAKSEADTLDLLKSNLGFSEAQAQTLLHAADFQGRPLTTLPGANGQPVTGAFIPQPAGAPAFRAFEEIPGIDINPVGGRGGATRTGLNREQLRNLEEFLEAIQMLEEANKLTDESFQAMVDVLTPVNDQITTTALNSQELFSAGIEAAGGVDELTTEMEDLIDQLLGGNEAMVELTATEQILAEATELQKTLVEEIAEAYEDLGERLRDGKISLEEYAQGQAAIEESARLASQLVAAVGDQLAKLPQFAAAAAQGTDALTAAVFDLMLKSTDLIPTLDPLIQQVIRLVSTEAAAITTTAQWAAHNYKLGSSFAAIREGSTATYNAAIAAMRASVSVGAATASQITSLINSILRGINSGTSKIFGTGPTISGGGLDKSVLDVGDLTDAQLQQAVKMALALQAKVPGATKEAADDLITLIRDAQFLKNLRGIDQQFLQIAIEELTEQMEEANRIAKEQLQRETALRNLTVSAGPLSALVSQPSLFGLAGSFASGNGLNFDPTKGNFVINVPIELKGLDPAALQQMIYDIITKAIRDAARL